MDVAEAVETRIEVREYSDEPVGAETKRAILDAGRLAPSGRNLQHWRFLLVDSDEGLRTLAEFSPSGSWISNADFAVPVCTDPSHDFNEIDAARAVTQMQLAAWELGVASRIFTVDQPEVREALAIPKEYDLTLVAGFGYPRREIQGVKSRKPLGEVAYSGTFGDPLEL